MSKPDCYKCDFSKEVPGNCHIACTNKKAKVVGNDRGIRKGWFFWPYLFDPVWLESCNGFSPKQESKV